MNLLASLSIGDNKRTVLQQFSFRLRPTIRKENVIWRQNLTRLSVFPVLPRVSKGTYIALRMLEGKSAKKILLIFSLWYFKCKAVCDTIVILVKSLTNNKCSKTTLWLFGKSFCFTIPYVNFLFNYRIAFQFRIFFIFFYFLNLGNILMHCCQIINLLIRELIR